MTTLTDLIVQARNLREGIREFTGSDAPPGGFGNALRAAQECEGGLMEEAAKILATKRG